jgi:WD40 repeat protein
MTSRPQRLARTWLAQMDDQCHGFRQRDRLRSLTSRMLVADLRGHTDTVHSALFNPDGTLVATSSSDQTARLWSVSSGIDVTVLGGRGGTVTSATFSPAGRRELTADGNTARNSASETCGSLDDLLALARARITRSLTEEERTRFL